MSDIQEQIKLAHKRAEENDIKLLKEEIKEILEIFKKINEEYSVDTELDFEDYEIPNIYLKQFLDYITNLQEYETIIEMEFKREYARRYLEERRKEEPHLLYPDSDEIYKRYYELKEENKKLKELCDKYEEEHNTEFKIWKDERYQLLDYKSRNEKVIEFCNYSLNNPWYISKRELLGAILKKAQGVDKE